MVKCFSEDGQVFYILVVFLYYIVFNVLWQYKDTKLFNARRSRCVYRLSDERESVSC